MLNRLFIVVGALAIVAMVAAFVVPHYYDWNPYRERLEQIAEEALGTPVTIRGELELTILPQPKMTLNDVVVGPPEAPVAEVTRIEAEFALMEFLRDRYEVTELLLTEPRITFRIDGDGHVEEPVHLAREVRTTNVSIKNAAVAGGTVTVNDARTGRRFSATDVAAALRLAALRGPFSVQATGQFEGAPYQLRVNTSDPNENGGVRLSMFLKPAEGRFALSTDGVLSLDGEGQPGFAGTLSWRDMPPTSDDVRTVSGAAVLDGTLEATPERLLLSAFTYLPDETRAGTRLSGAAEVRLGTDPQFDAVVSGGVVALLEPRDVREQSGPEAYPLLTLIDALPVPPATGMTGRIGVDIAELDLRGLSLRDVRLDARTDGADWQVEQFSGRLAGETTLSLSGLSRSGTPTANFAGRVAVSSQRLDALARGWTDPGDDNPLFGATGSLAARVRLDDASVTFSNGTADIDGKTLAFSGKVTRWPAPQLEANIEMGELDSADSAKAAALLPDAAGGGPFAVSFPQGVVGFSAGRLFYGGQDLRDVDVSASWVPGRIDFDRFKAADAAGSAVSASGLVTGTMASPHVTGNADVTLADGTRVADLWGLLPLPALPEAAMTVIRASRPAELSLTLEDTQSPAQALSFNAVSPLARMQGSAALAEGIFAAASSPLELSFGVEAPDRTALATALGVAPAIAAGLVRGEAVAVSGDVSGTPMNSVTARLAYTAGDEKIGFDGTVLASADGLSGHGRLDVRLSDFAGYADLLGLGGFSLPAVIGIGDLVFEGLDSVTVSDIDAVIAGERIRGELGVSRAAGEVNYSGSLGLGRLDIAALGEFGGGAAALVPGDGVWPIGPISVGQGQRSSRGRVQVDAGRLTHGNTNLLHDVSFEFAWDGTENRVRELTGALGEGEVTVDARLCCANDLSSKQLSGRFNLDGVDLALLAPPALAARLGGVVRASGQFSGAGDSLADIVASLGGDGSFTVDGLSVEDFSPTVFSRVAAIDNVVELEPAALTGAVAEALAAGPLTVPTLEGLFTIAAGSVRVTNLAAETGDVRLVGSAALNLADFGLDSSWSLTPTAAVGGNGLITETTGQVSTTVKGPLTAPVSRLDVAQMVDALKVRAYEIEVARLERLRAEDEARIRSAAVERQRQMAVAAVAKAVAAREAAAKQAVHMAEARIIAWQQAELARQLAAIAAERAAAAQQGPAQFEPVPAPAPPVGPPPAPMPQILVPENSIEYVEPDDGRPISLLPPG